MFARAFTPTALAVALALSTSTAAAQAFHYAPGTSHFRMASDAKVTTTVMGQTSDGDVTSGQKFTMEIAQQAPDTLSISVTIDSISQVTPMGPTQGLEALVGKHVQALFSPSGEFYAKVATDTGAALASVGDQLVRLLPHIRKPLAAGVSWTDTSSESTTQSGLTIKRQVVSTYTVAGDTAIGGTTAWKLTRTSTATTSGIGNVQGQNASMNGTSIGQGMVFVTHDGVFLGETGEEQAKTKLTLTDAGVSYDSNTTARTTLERLN